MPAAALSSNQGNLNDFPWAAWSLILSFQKHICEAVNVGRACLNQASGTYECIKLLAATARSYEQLCFLMHDWSAQLGGHDQQ